MQTEIRKLIEQFTVQVVAAAKQDAMADIFLSLSRSKLPAAKHPTVLAAVKQRRKGPIQLCPVPRCKGRAAPVFGMVCAEHKAVPKAKIAKYREARRKRVSAGRRA